MNRKLVHLSLRCRQQNWLSYISTLTVVLCLIQCYVGNVITWIHHVHVQVHAWEIQHGLMGNNCLWENTVLVTTECDDILFCAYFLIFSLRCRNLNMCKTQNVSHLWKFSYGKYYTNVNIVSPWDKYNKILLLYLSKVSPQYTSKHYD